MVWAGVVLILAGAIATFTVDGHVGGLDSGVAGVVAMVAGAALLVIGLVRLNRMARPDRGRGIRPGVQDRLYRTGKGKIIAMIAVVAYILSPIDLIPDVFLPVGIVDDATAFTWLLFAIGQEVSRHRRRRRALDRVRPPG
jgi:drug/metabolite transporter (DMT)-like permease